MNLETDAPSGPPREGGDVLLASRADTLTDPAFWFVGLPAGLLTMFLVELVRKRRGAEKTRGWRTVEYVALMVVGGAAYFLAVSAGFGG